VERDWLVRLDMAVRPDASGGWPDLPPAIAQGVVVEPAAVEP